MLRVVGSRNINDKYVNYIYFFQNKEHKYEL